MAALASIAVHTNHVQGYSGTRMLVMHIDVALEHGIVVLQTENSGGTICICSLGFRG